jgi:hypothetical protein
MTSPLAGTSSAAGDWLKGIDERSSYGENRAVTDLG